MFKIRHMGCDSVHSSDFCLCRPKGFDFHLALYVKTPALFILDGVEQRTKENMFILFDRNSWIHYRGVGKEYVDDWIQLEIDEEPAISYGKPYYLSDIVPISEYTHMLLDAYYRGSQVACSHLVSALFSELALASGSPDITGTHYKSLAGMRKEIYSFPERDWSVGNMSKRLGLSPAHLQKLYKDTFGVTCRADVINSRVETAKLLLDGTGLSISEVGYRCGYNSQVHFSRQFCALTGLPPSKWRQKK